MASCKLARNRLKKVKQWKSWHLETMAFSRWFNFQLLNLYFFDFWFLFRFSFWFVVNCRSALPLNDWIYLSNDLDWLLENNWLFGGDSCNEARKRGWWVARLIVWPQHHAIWDLVSGFQPCLSESGSSALLLESHLCFDFCWSSDCSGDVEPNVELFNNLLR